MKTPFIVKLILIVGLSVLSKEIYSQSDVIFVVNMTKDGVDYYKSRGAKENRDVDAVFSFLREDFNSTVVYSEEQISDVLSSAKSIKNVVYVGWEIGTFKRDLGAVGRYPMKIVFGFSDDSKLEYDCSVNVNGYTYDSKMAVLRAIRKNVKNDEIYSKIGSVKINSDAKVLSKEILKMLEDSLSLDNNSIFGIYKLISSSNFTSLSKIGIFQYMNEVLLVNIENSAFKGDWKIGQIIGKLNKTSSSKYFIGTYKGVVGNEDEISIMFNDNIIEFTFIKNKTVRKFMKIK